MSLKRGNCGGNPRIRDCRVVGGHNRRRIPLRLVSYISPPKHSNRDLARCVSPSEFQISQEWPGTRAGAPGATCQLMARHPLLMTKETSSSVEKESLALQCP